MEGSKRPEIPRAPFEASRLPLRRFRRRRGVGGAGAGTVNGRALARRPALVWIAVAAALGGAVVWLAVPRGRAAGPLPDGAYVWQRRFGPEVRQAVREAGALSPLVFLAAEVDPTVEPPRVTRLDLDGAFLRALGRPVGLALRIGPLHGTFAGRPATAERLLGLAARTAAAARAAGLAVAELELDYDCPASKLADYAAWVKRVRRAVAPVPTVITALPTWLAEPRAMGELIAAADGFVLQVHSLERPMSAAAPLVLCDPRAAKAAVEEAARFGRPFRVALPTYGYIAAFEPRGRLLGLAAEGPALNWPTEVKLVTASADPAAMAGLVAGWRRDRPRELAGILWYRLPVAGDRQAWPAATFRAVRQGRTPRPALAATARAAAGDPALLDVALANAGEAPGPLPAALRLQWSGPAALLAADGLALYRVRPDGPGRLLLTRRAAEASAIAPGDERPVGWVRFDRPTEAHLALVP